MGLGRRKFLQLFGTTIATVAANPLQALVIDGDLYINRTLGIAFRKPIGWNFVSLKEFQPLKDSQVLKDDAFSEELRGAEDPIAVITKIHHEAGQIGPSITVYAEIFELEADETLLNVLPGMEGMYQKALSSCRHLGTPSEPTISGCNSIEYLSEFLFENSDTATMARNRSIISVREPQLYTFNMFDYPSKAMEAQNEYNDFVASIAFV